MAYRRPRPHVDLYAIRGVSGISVECIRPARVCVACKSLSLCMLSLREVISCGRSFEDAEANASQRPQEFGGFVD